MQKTLDDYILEIRAQIREADKNTEIMGDLTKGLFVQNMVMDVLGDVIERNGQLSEKLRLQYPRPISFQERVARELQPESIDDTWSAPRMMNR